MTICVRHRQPWSCELARTCGLGAPAKWHRVGGAVRRGGSDPELEVRSVERSASTLAAREYKMGNRACEPK
eukprot:6178942-Pleurochrysis_carterae.AAC.2